MKVFLHHIYEYKKGLRSLILHTCDEKYYQSIVNRLETNGIDYVIYFIGNHKINIFFGHKNCVDLIKSVGKPKLNEYTNEEDFMLGIMLGYDKINQCARYLHRKERASEVTASIDLVS